MKARTVNESAFDIKELEIYIQELFEHQHDARLVYHNYAQTVAIVKQAERLIKELDIASSQISEIIIISCWFLNTGYLKNYEKAGEEAVRQAKIFIDSVDFSAKKGGQIIQSIKAAFGLKEPENLEEKCVRDARQSVLFGENFITDLTLRKLEEELMRDHVWKETDWIPFQLQQLLQVKFFTPAAKQYFEPVAAQNILKLKERLDKTQKKGKTTDDSTPARVTQRTVQTFFRSNYRNHINLSSIADNKANIMISVNAILISVIISILSYRNLTESNPMILMPAIIFLITGLTSLIFAVLSARPKVTKLNEPADEPEKIQRNLIFFGNFVHLDVEKYETSMDELFKDGSLLLGNMTRDLYYLGKVLDKKYRYLSISYNVFMLGFIMTVVTFLLALFS